MEPGIFSTEIKCVSCSDTFKTCRVKSSALRPDYTDTDFCKFYKGPNPMFYEIWICPNCGFADYSDCFVNPLNKNEKIKFDTIIAPRWENSRDFGSERSPHLAIDAYMVGLANFLVRSSNAFKLAKTYIRIAWLYRMLKDTEKELEFLKQAIHYYHSTYFSKTLPIGKFDKITCLYILGELNFRLGNFDEAKRWFGNILSIPSVNKSKMISDNISDRMTQMRISQ